ncbi:MAG: hypothetical protein FRX48_01176 [Lasallia pustulata]|uniref:YCII-related n=1 Tax=Lasallia pustulata TaxID=136370 RepID=A0A1W5CS85_9LECA|nr:MAG: hypothetical protein FRX48_01176 [Lasallia pustulata]SLM33683.1 YCII-related [Lasallia pustulata]
MSASSAATKHEWIVILPDHEGALERRMQVRQDHLKNLNRQVEKGFWTFGGALLDEAPKEGGGLKINGSVMLAVAESKEEVLEVLKKDIYCTSGVWDWGKVQIHAFKTAIGKLA